MKKWKWFVYVIECVDGLYYTGLTWNLEQRLEQHRLGQGGRFTKWHTFKKLCYFEEFANIQEARDRERQLKDFSRQKKRSIMVTFSLTLEQ